MNRLLFIVIVLFALSACDANSPDLRTRPTADPAPEAESKFDIVKRCYSLESVQTGAYVVATANGFNANEASLPDAEAFFMQAAYLGQFIFYATDRRMLTSGANVSGNATNTDEAIWHIDYDDATESYFFNASMRNGDGNLVINDQIRMGVNESGDLVTTTSTGTDTLFKFTPTTIACTPYPEMPVDIEGEAFKGTSSDPFGPVLGFADAHNHMGMSYELSYDDTVGPSGGGAVWGKTFHRYGVAHALGDCAESHGPQGEQDANTILQSSPQPHDTGGWPTHVDWPFHAGLTHTVMYYRWVERAYKSGLRLMVNLGTNIKGLCDVGDFYHDPEYDADCNDMSIALKQNEYIKQLIDYIDAQSGGPGQGWMQIAYSPRHARKLINNGKLAIVLGIEVAQVLDCGVTFTAAAVEDPDDQVQGDGFNEAPNNPAECTEEKIAENLQKYWDLGARHIYPFHDIDSYLGGAGIFTGTVMNGLNKIDTDKFFILEECRDYPDEPLQRTPGGTPEFRDPTGGELPSEFTGLGTNNGHAPIYADGEECNSRHITNMGDYVLSKMIENRYVIDLDHASYHGKDRMLDWTTFIDPDGDKSMDESNTNLRVPPYPMVSTHDAHGGLTSDQISLLLRNGGIVFPYKGDGNKHQTMVERHEFWRNKAKTDYADAEDNFTILGIGFGVDGNGFGGHAGPRGATPEPINYPFTLYDGDGWGSQFDDIEPVIVHQNVIEESGKAWHIDEHGMAHYGMIAGFVEDVRIASGEEGITALFNSAEAYIQAWEKTYYRDGVLPTDADDPGNIDD